MVMNEKVGEAEVKEKVKSRSKVCIEDAKTWLPMSSCILFLLHELTHLVGFILKRKKMKIKKKVTETQDRHSVYSV